jgi:hypothetical protein
LSEKGKIAGKAGAEAVGKLAKIAKDALPEAEAVGKAGGKDAAKSAAKAVPRPHDPSFTSRPKWRDRHGFLTDGHYRVSGAASARHTAGTAPPGKSYFAPDTDVDQVSLDAAQYADHANLWGPDGKAKVKFDREVGTLGSTGQPTDTVNVYRKKSGTIHASPGSSS